MPCLPLLCSDAPTETPMEVGEGPSLGEADVPKEPLDLNSALQMVLKKSLAHDGLARGLHEVVREIEREGAQLVVLSENCDQGDYKKLIEALCHEKNVNLMTVPDKMQLGEWCGLCKIDEEGEATKVVGCSCAVVLNYGEDSHALNCLMEHLKKE